MMNDKLSIGSLNARSLCTVSRHKYKILELEHFVLEENLDLCVVSETWLNSNIFTSEITPQG